MNAKIEVLFFLAVVQNICIAQSCFPTLADNPRWRVAENIVYQPPGQMYFIDYTMEKDTLINGLTYTIIIGSDTSHYIYKTYRVGFSRTAGKRLYFRPTTDNKEYLISDFGLNVGESCYCSVLGNDTAKFLVTNIDTININGFERKRIRVESDFLSPDYWIEGIGSIQNPFVSYRIGVYDALRCLTTNMGTIYIDPKYNECDSNNSLTHTIVNSNMQWSGLEKKISNTETDTLISYYIHFNGDSIKNGEKYSKIWKSYDSLGIDWQFVGLIREVYNQIWFLPPGEEKEFLLYDFSHGNKLMIFSPPSNIIYVDITNVDSVEINSEMRKRIQLSYQGKNIDTWIEKIGSRHGILSSCYDKPGWENNLLCVTENTTLIYINPNYQDCFYSMKSLTNNSQKFENQQIIIYPNPITNKLIVVNNSSNPEKLDLKLFDAYGRLVYKKILNELSNETDFSTIPRGLYLIQINTNCLIYIEKIIKQ